MSEQEPHVDTEIWERALNAANRRLDPSEQDWTSWRCGGGPHQSAIKDAGRIITKEQIETVPDIGPTNPSSGLLEGEVRDHT